MTWLIHIGHIFCSIPTTTDKISNNSRLVFKWLEMAAQILHKIVQSIIWYKTVQKDQILNIVMVSEYLIYLWGFKSRNSGVSVYGVNYKLENEVTCFGTSKWQLAPSLKQVRGCQPKMVADGSCTWSYSCLYWESN